MRKIEYVCLVGCIGLIGADRIDLAAGHLPFILTPFLFLASMVLLLHLVRTPPHRLFQLTITPPIQRQLPFLAACSLFLCFAFASIPIGLDPDRGLVAFCDLLVVSFLGYFISVRILDEPAQGKLIVRSVTFALVLYILFCIGECIAWSHGIFVNTERAGSWLEVTFGASTLGPWVPALSGTTFDPNRSGLILTMYLVLLDTFVPESRSKKVRVLRYIIALLVLLALSRSAALCWSAYYLFSRKFWKRLASRRLVIRLAAIVILTSLVCAVYQAQIANLLEAWEISDAVSTKLSMAEGSSGESHVLLIERGFETWLSSPKTIITGIGYAAAPKVLEDFFGNDKRANFHDIYVTVLAEMGLPAFLVLMFIFGYPIVGRKGAFRGVAALMVFNISYQSHTEPMFWLILAILWSFERTQWSQLRSSALAGGCPGVAPITVVS
ncbi:MAG: O-antigen ligase family protein [Candidatus Sulfotelmatobacter sp.]